MEPLAGLGQDPVAGPQRRQDGGWRLLASHVDLHACANCVSIAGGSIADQTKCEPVMLTGYIVAEQPQLGSATIDNPEVEVAVVVPVHTRHGPAVIGEVEAADRRNVGEMSVAKIQEAAVSLPTAKRMPAADHILQHVARR